MSEYICLKIPRKDLNNIRISQGDIWKYRIDRFPVDPRLKRVYEQVTGLLQFVQLAGTAELIYKVLKEVIEDE